MLRTAAITLMAIAAVLMLALASLAPASAESRPLSKRAQRGLAFAQENCAACHAVTMATSSPNPESPPFEAIANMPGLTSETLQAYLRDSHNYPSAMSFEIDRRQIRDLADYMLTLRGPDYRPPI